MEDSDSSFIPPMAEVFLKNCDGVVLVFSVDDHKSLPLGPNHVCVIVSHRCDTNTSVWYFVSMEIYKVSRLRDTIMETWYFIHFSYSEFQKN